MRKQPKPTKQPEPANRQIIRQTTYSGPIPQAEELAKFDQVLPGLAKQITEMAFKEAEHRHHIEREALAADVSIAKMDRVEAMLGQIFGLIIGLTTIFCGTYLAATGHPVTGTLIGSSGVIGLVSVFVMGRKSK